MSITLTSFTADHSGMFQNRDNNNGKITQMEICSQCVNACKLTRFLDHSGIFQNRDNNNGKINQMETKSIGQ